jgi:hypothetical protein
LRVQHEKAFEGFLLCLAKLALSACFQAFGEFLLTNS